MPVLTPAEMLTSARRQCDREGGVWKPLHEQKDERGRRAPARHHLGEIDAEMEKQVRVQALSVLVDQPCEAEASPT